MAAPAEWGRMAATEAMVGVGDLPPHLSSLAKAWEELAEEGVMAETAELEAVEDKEGREAIYTY
ncbi:hypothetical protein [Sinorhizobium meliloti]|uniref:hypothetical protein n=1 Tax=Rhizobium meliloti TaxID=382 RepID=UPI0012974852|nr:hypothetical protein [Sinorhizobium meliloti]MQW55244.1 hypothetical protein [Sinorhizobium meliloti]